MIDVLLYYYETQSRVYSHGRKEEVMKQF